MSIKFELPSNIDVFNATTLTSTSITATSTSVTSSFTVNGFQIDLSGGATTNQVLQYNGTKFIAATISSGAISGSLTSTKIPYATGTSTLADSGMSWNSGSSIFTVTTVSNTAGLKVTDGTHVIEMKPDNTNNVSSMGSGSNHDLVFYTNSGSQQLRLTTAGLFGIGASSPTYQLDVFGDARTSARFIMDGSSAAVSPSSKGSFRYNSSTQHIEFSENGGSWQQIVSASGTVSGSFTAGRIPYANSTTTLTDSGLEWDDVNQLFGVGQLAPIARLDVSQASATSGNPMAFRVLGGSMTTMPASTEILDVYFNLGRTIQRNAGAVASQRAILVTAPTYSFTGASTMTTAASFAIEGAPSPGTNATITNAYSLWVQAGLAAFDGHIKVDGITIDLSGGATTNQVLAYNGTKFIAVSTSANLSGTLTSTKIPYATGSTTLSDTNMAWDSSNKILTLTTNASTLGSKVTDGTITTALGVDSTTSSGQIGTSSNHNLTFLANSSVKMTLTAANGYLGIGATPSYALHTSGDGYVTSRLIVGGIAGAVSPSNTGAFRYNTSTNHIEFSENGGTWTQIGAGGGGGMSIGASVTSGTSGSILYVDASSNLAQDNSNFFWDATNHRLGIGTTSPSNPLSVVASSSSTSAAQTEVVILQNSDTTNNNYALFGFVSKTINGTVVSAARIGTQITSHTNAALNGDFVIQTTASSTPNERLRVASDGGVQFASSNSAAVSASSTGRIRYNSSTQHFESSESAGAYTQMVTSANAVTIGNAVPSGTSGSILYVNSSVQLAQDNNNFFWDATNKRLGIGTTASPSAQLHVVQPVVTAGSPSAFILTGGAHTTLTASTEAIDGYYKLDRAVQFTNGALTTQRAVYLSAPTYGFTGPSTITTAATLAVGNAPQAGTNATITKAYSIWAQAGVAAFDGHIKVDGYTFDLSAGATTNQVLAYDGTKFVATAANAGTISGSIATNQVAYGSGTNAIQGSSGLTYNGTTLTVAQHISVDGYTIDVSAGATTNQVLQYNGTKFVAATVSGGGGGGFGTTGEKVNSAIRVGGRSSYGSSSPLAIGAIAFNPNDYTLTGTTKSVKLRAVVANGSNGLTTHVKLRNITDGEDVATLDFTSTTSTKVESTLTIGTSTGNIKTSEKIYEVRIYVDSPVSGVDTIELYSAELLVINTIN